MEKEKTVPVAQKKIQDQVWWQGALFMFFRLSAWVVVPVLLATLFGKWLDEKYESAPFGLMSIVGLAFLISMFGLIKEASKEFKKISKEDSHSAENKSFEK